MPSPRRSPAPRRPRVAGAQRAEAPGAEADRLAVDDEPPAPVTPGAPVTSGGPDGVARLVGLVAILLIAIVLAAWFRGEAAQLRESAGAGNEALVDVGATAQAVGQVRDGLETVFSYDFARLAENQAAAREVITGEFVADFEEQFGRVRDLAPGQQAVVTATVPNIGVKVLQGDRAVLFAFIDQQATRLDADPTLSAGRVVVTAERVDGPEGSAQWKIASVDPR